MKIDVDDLIIDKIISKHEISSFELLTFLNNESNIKISKIH